MADYYNWCMQMKENWEAKNAEKVIDLFDEDVEYYETPKDKVTYKEIKLIWEEIKEQNTNQIEFNILCQNEESCIANFILKDTVSYDMVYQIKLNENNKCTFFKQWYMEV